MPFDPSSASLAEPTPTAGGFDPASARPAPAHMMSRMDLIQSGFSDPLIGAAQLGTHLAPGDTSNWMDQYVQKREADIQARTPETRWRDMETHLDAQGRATHEAGPLRGPTGSQLRLLGEMANPLPYLGAMVPGGEIAEGAAMGALAGLTTPVTSKGFWGQKALQTSVGAATGAGVAVGGKFVGGMIRPELERPVQTMVDAGVPLTPGMMAGPTLRRAEEAMRSAPITGTYVRAAEQRTLEGFNRATANLALQPIGVTVPKDAAGHEIIQAGQDALSAAYNQVIPKMSFKADWDFVQSLQTIAKDAASLPRDEQAQLDTIWRQRVTYMLDPQAGMDGRTLNDTQSYLRSFYDRYRRSTDPAQRQLAEHVLQIREALFDAMGRQNPAVEAEFRKVRTAYAGFIRVEDAAARRTSSEATFTPNDLLGAIKSEDSSIRKRMFARGDAMLQPWATDAQHVMGNKLGDSGTAERGFWDRPLVKAAERVGGGGLAGLAALHPAEAAVGAAGTIGVATAMGAPWTRVGQRAMQRYVANPAPWRDKLGDMFRQGAAYAVPPIAHETVPEGQ